uniref:MoxR family ATPase n=1 Tax=Desulfacinum infernum TaxID=35837 RepID=A0A832EI46_9BACT
MAEATDFRPIVDDLHLRLRSLQEEISRIVIGQQDLINGLLIALLCNGHMLIEGLPGLAKTLTVTTLARALQLSFQRIQFTPDLLPSDLIGTLIFHPKTGDFVPKKGPIFHQIILADEINRAPAKVQSALLEAMQERQVTIGDTTYALPQPYMVLATQNPIEQEGTYPLPEAQLDRFLMKVQVKYPSFEEEEEILLTMARSKTAVEIRPILSPEEIEDLQRYVDGVHVDPKIRTYTVHLVRATRNPREYGLPVERYLLYGASPRGGVSVVLAARAWAFLSGRDYVTPGDVKKVAFDALRHRLILSYEAEMEGLTADDILREILEHVPVP